MSTAASANYSQSINRVAPRAGSSATWADLVRTWEDYKAEKESMNLVFIGDGEGNADEIMVAPYSHRFQQGYTRMQYAKIQGFIGGALEEYQDPHLVFLTFSTTTLKPNGEYRPPLDHMDELLASWGDGVYYELNRVMAGDRKRDPWEPRPDWEYLYILEPTTDEGHVPGGYVHAHAALVVDGPVEAARFESVINRHLTECPGARGEAHEFDDAIEVKRAEELGNPGAYLFKYLGKSWDTEGMADYEKRFAALLFDQGRQRFRASNGAQRWMQRDEEESTAGEWIFAGQATDAQARELREFEDYEDFLVATNETGLRSWLQKYEVVTSDGPEGWEIEEMRELQEEAEERQRRREELAELRRQTMLVHSDGAARERWVGTSPVGDRPPPA